MRLFTCWSFLLFFGCSEKHSDNAQTHIDSSGNAEIANSIHTEIDNSQRKPAYFSPVLSFPLIQDSAEFIRQLKEISDGDCGFDEPFSGEQKISFYKKVKINGSRSELILLEYIYSDGPSACYPYKEQFLFTPEGKLITTLNALRFELIKIFPGQKPFLLTVISTSKGNGGHQLYKVSRDTLENIYEGYMDYEVQTYDAGEDQFVFEPNELKPSVQDKNNDGFNDLVFTGKLVMIQGLSKDSIWYDGEYSIDKPFKKFPVRYVFLFDAKSGRFKESRKYSMRNPFNN